MKWICLFLCCLSTVLIGQEVKLTVCPEHTADIVLFSTSDNEKIAQCLEKIGVQFEQWEANQPLNKDPTHDEILNAYQNDVERIKDKGGFAQVDVVSIRSDNPKKEVFRQKFLKEHLHTTDEVRFFVEGFGIFYNHKDKKVLRVRCEKGDLISIPANYTHWFDMTDDPYFTAIRFFTDEEGWVAHFTDDDIADKFISIGGQ